MDSVRDMGRGGGRGWTAWKIWKSFRFPGPSIRYGHSCVLQLVMRVFAPEKVDFLPCPCCFELGNNGSV